MTATHPHLTTVYDGDDIRVRCRHKSHTLPVLSDPLSIMPDGWLERFVNAHDHGDGPEKPRTRHHFSHPDDDHGPVAA